MTLLPQPPECWVRGMYCHSLLDVCFYSALPSQVNVAGVTEDVTTRSHPRPRPACIRTHPLEIWRLTLPHITGSEILNRTTAFLQILKTQNSPISYNWGLWAVHERRSLTIAALEDSSWSSFLVGFSPSYYNAFQANFDPRLSHAV